MLLLMAQSGAALAGCGIEITFKNELSQAATLDIQETKVRMVTGGTAPVPLGAYSRFMDAPVTIPAGAERKRRASLDQGCAAAVREFKFFFASGSQIHRVNKIVVTAVDQKFNVRIRD